ncbi:MAG: hypothetical protein GTO71_11320, partial [Woeseiaceae bacterium]|nr:hypothetical protein [Woeseiaceae bacterium]NIP21657.1 hypothetical protein [Woeseiaceae bacterium]
SLKLANGRLDVDPLTFRENAGRFDAGLLFAPHESGYALDANLQVDNVRLGILGSAQQERDLLPPLNGVVRLSGSGASVHEIMAGAEGNISLRHGSGQIRDFSGRLFGDLLLEVLRTLNPLRSGSDTRQLDCAIYEVAIEAGVAEIQELALQTNALTMIGSGRIDFDTEKLDINVRAKPREGIGLSIGSLANSFLKVGGSL